MRRWSTRAGFALAPVVVLGTVALISGPGRHRVIVLALGVLLGAALGFMADDAGGGERRSAPSNGAPGRLEASPVLLPAQASDQDSSIS